MKDERDPLVAPTATCTDASPAPLDGWLRAFRTTGDEVRYSQDLPQGGKWLLFPPHDEVDAVWQTVAELTEADRLGPAAKVAAECDHEGTHVICVYCDRWQDTNDLLRVLGTLRDAGHGRGWMKFKRGEETLKHVYARSGQRSSIFTAPPRGNAATTVMYTSIGNEKYWLDGADADAAIIRLLEQGESRPSWPTT